MKGPSSAFRPGVARRTGPPAKRGSHGADEGRRGKGARRDWDRKHAREVPERPVAEW